MGRFDDLTDDLDSVLNSALDSGKQPPAQYAPASFTETCAKCRGTGRFVGYTGRVLGECFACKGAGKKTFKSAPEKRSAARERNAEKAAAVELDRRESVVAFAREHAAVWAWLQDNLTAREPFAFATAMHEALHKYGSLTDKQLAACQRCVAAREAARERRAAERKSQAAALPVVDLAKLETLFDTARKNGLSRLNLRLSGYTFSPAKSHSANAGAIYVKTTRGTEYLGKIAGGRFLALRHVTEDQKAKVTEIAGNPLAAAAADAAANKASGFSGSCCCCGRELTDPDSIAAGIGPDCAANWGM